MEPLTSDDPVEIGGFRLRARLGAGGMGRVYLASTKGGRRVALKVVRPELGDDPDFRSRFRQEIEAAQRVRGLYTAELINANPAATPPWLVTAYVPGPSLQQAVAEHGPMPAETVILLMAGVAEALQAIHDAGVVHRDLKPSNVLLAPDGPRVIDFGIAQGRGGHQPDPERRGRRCPAVHGAGADPRPADNGGGRRVRAGRGRGLRAAWPAAVRGRARGRADAPRAGTSRRT